MLLCNAKNACSYYKYCKNAPPCKTCSNSDACTVNWLVESRWLTSEKQMNNKYAGVIVRNDISKKYKLLYNGACEKYFDTIEELIVFVDMLDDCMHIIISVVNLRFTTNVYDIIYPNFKRYCFDNKNITLKSMLEI